ncbi:MAG: hypothetical protein ACRD5G_13470 [Candidatus Acidiferrales bacterium]
MILSACAAREARDTNPAGSPSQLVDTSVVTPASICDIAKSRSAFDRRFLRIDAYISRGFEDSGLHDPSCAEEAVGNMRQAQVEPPRIWVEFADEARHERVSGFPPLLQDEPLRQLRALLLERGRAGQMTRAILIGTFYAGKQYRIQGNSFWGGHGHMGCCSLFVVSRVESVVTSYSDTLNYSWADWNTALPQGCYSGCMLGLPTNDTMRRWQEEAAQGQDAWRYDPDQVAQNHLTRIKRGDYGAVSGRFEQIWPDKKTISPPADSQSTGSLTLLSSTSYLRRYEFIEADLATRFLINVSRPYWLATVAGTPERVIWVPAGATMFTCVTTKDRGKRTRP